jgi:uncharacterized protein
MDAIYIPQLAKAPERTEEIKFDESLPGIETLTPVRGHIRVQHHGNYLDVLGEAETIMTLTCSRCLQQYNHRLVMNKSEIIWLDEISTDDLPLEQEVAFEDLLETLSPSGYFHPSEWLYEHLCLTMPLKQLCDRKCPGIVPKTANTSEQLVDRRWSSLEELKKQLP